MASGFAREPAHRSEAKCTRGRADLRECCGYSDTTRKTRGQASIRVPQRTKRAMPAAKSRERAARRQRELGAVSERETWGADSQQFALPSLRPTATDAQEGKVRHD